jgi:hypothetical protein
MSQLIDWTKEKPSEQSGGFFFLLQLPQLHTANLSKLSPFADSFSTKYSFCN